MKQTMRMSLAFLSARILILLVACLAMGGCTFLRNEFMVFDKAAPVAPAEVAISGVDAAR
jgi:hypothetical protein